MNSVIDNARYKIPLFSNGYKVTQRYLILTLLAVFFSQPASSLAGNVVSAFVDEQDGHYLINLSMQINAAKQNVLKVMTNYSQLEKLSNTIVSSTVIEQKSKSSKVKLVSEGCIFIFCQTIIQMQNVNQLENDYITINVEPMPGHIKFSTQLWQFKAVSPSVTQVQYSADILPDFWIPPLIGSWLFQNRLIDEARLIINSAEKIANSNSSSRYTP